MIVWSPAAADAATVAANAAGVFSFTPDVAGYYEITFTKGGTATTAFVASTYAPLNGPPFTGSVSGITKTMVGLPMLIIQLTLESQYHLPHKQRLI